MCRSKDNNDLDCAEVECHNVVWTELTPNKWLPWALIQIKYFQAEKRGYSAWWKHEYKQFWTANIAKMRKSKDRNIELGVARIDFLRFQASASVWLRSALFRVAARRGSVWPRRPIFKGQYVQGRTSWPLKAGPICCPEMSVINQTTLWNSPEERRALKNTSLTWPEIAQHPWLPHTHNSLIQAAMPKLLQ